MKKLILGLTLLATTSSFATEGNSLVNKRIDFDKETYIQAIQSEDMSLLYEKVPANTVDAKTPKEKVKEELIKMVEIRDTMERNGNMDSFNAKDHLESSRKLDEAISKVDDLNFKAFAHNLKTELNFYFFGFNARK